MPSSPRSLIEHSGRVKKESQEPVTSEIGPIPVVGHNFNDVGKALVTPDDLEQYRNDSLGCHVFRREWKEGKTANGTCFLRITQSKCDKTVLCLSSQGGKIMGSKIWVCVHLKDI